MLNYQRGYAKLKGVSEVLPGTVIDADSEHVMLDYHPSDMSAGKYGTCDGEIESWMPQNLPSDVPHGSVVGYFREKVLPITMKMEGLSKLHQQHPKLVNRAVRGH